MRWSCRQNSLPSPLAGALLALSAWTTGCAWPREAPAPVPETVASDADAEAVRPCRELEILAVSAELASLEIASLLAEQNAGSCEFYFDPDQRPRRPEERERLSTARLGEVGARIEALRPRVPADQRAAFDRDVVEPYRRLREKVGVR